MPQEHVLQGLVVGDQCLQSVMDAQPRVTDEATAENARYEMIWRFTQARL
jgi:hypothetical protein